MGRVIVCGSRTWRDREIIHDRLSKLPPGTTIVVGGALGADTIAEEEAYVLGHKVELHKAQWSLYGRKAGFVRNSDMADRGASLCIAFWDGISTGTQHMIDQAKRRRIPVEVIES